MKNSSEMALPERRDAAANAGGIASVMSAPDRRTTCIREHLRLVRACRALSQWRKFREGRRDLSAVTAWLRYQFVGEPNPRFKAFYDNFNGSVEDKLIAKCREDRFHL